MSWGADVSVELSDARDLLPTDTLLIRDALGALRLIHIIKIDEMPDDRHMLWCTDNFRLQVAGNVEFTVVT